MTDQAPSPPADAESRRRFIEEVDQNFCVRAGAGAGKTTAITRRIARLALRRGEEPRVLSKLVVVTYTVLAAEELRTRTRREILRQAITREKGAGKSAFGRQELLSDLRGAFFGTIHGFCLKLIREFGAPLGLPGDPDLLVDADLDARWEEFAQSGALDDIAVPPELLRHMTFAQLLDFARRLADEDLAKLLDAAEPGPYPPSPDPSAVNPNASAQAKSRQKAQGEHEALLAFLADLATPGIFAPLPTCKGGGQEFTRAYDECLAPLRAWLAAASLRTAVQMAHRFERRRLALGLLSYADQIRFARRLLDDPDILREMRGRGWRVILDEAQDTDAAMFEILAEITRPLEAPPGRWPRENPGPEPGRFSFVGDEQQSIYGDRADPADYRRYVAAYQQGSGGEALTFDVTMRCSECVVTAVNQIFAEGIREQPQVEFRHLRSRPEAAAGQVWRVEIPPPELPFGKDVNAAFLHEAWHVGDWLRERGPAGLEMERWSDLAVIAPRTKWLSAAARTWMTEFGIPVRELSSQQICLECPAVSWPTALLHVLIHPEDRFELVGVLREIFAVSDRELALQHLGPGLAFWPRVADPAAETSPRLHEALQQLHGLRRLLVEGGISAGQLFDAVMLATRLPARLEALDQPLEPLQTLRASAIGAECAGQSTREWVRSLVLDLDRAAPEVHDSTDAVTFLTSQKSKGLEWPAVLLIGFGRSIRKGGENESYPRLGRDGGNELIVVTHPGQSKETRDLRRTENMEEWQRYLYVSMTRAKTLLVVPDSSMLYSPSKVPDASFAGLAKWISSAPPSGFLVPPAAQRARARRAKAKSAPAPSIAMPETNSLARAARISRDIPKSQSPSALAHAAEETGDTELAPRPAVDPLDDEFVPLLEPGGKDYGTWWHDSLQSFPWRAVSAGNGSHLASARARIPAGARWAERAIEELARFGQSDLRRAISSEGAQFLAEIPFARALAGSPPTWMEGVIDLLVLREDGTAWIVDWKTDRRQQGESPDALLARLRTTYAAQLEAYAGAIAAMGPRVTRKTLYSTALGAAIDC